MPDSDSESEGGWGEHIGDYQDLVGDFNKKTSSYVRSLTLKYMEYLKTFKNHVSYNIKKGGADPYPKSDYYTLKDYIATNQDKVKKTSKRVKEENGKN